MANNGLKVRMSMQASAASTEIEKLCTRHLLEQAAKSVRLDIEQLQSVSDQERPSRSYWP